MLIGVATPELVVEFVIMVLLQAIVLAVVLLADEED